jgi:hypothetical protein
VDEELRGGKAAEGAKESVIDPHTRVQGARRGQERGAEIGNDERANRGRHDEGPTSASGRVAHPEKRSRITPEATRARAKRAIAKTNRGRRS